MDKQEFSVEELEGQGIYYLGQGILPKAVMMDNRLSLIAKAIYAYFCVQADDIPGVKTICEDLDINRDTFYKYQKQLIATGYIKSAVLKNSQGRFTSDSTKQLCLYPKAIEEEI